MGEKAVGEKHKWVITKLVDETHMGERSVGVKNKTYVGNKQLGATHMGEKSMCEKNYG